MATKKQLEALAKGREKLAKSRKLNGLKDFFKKKSDKKTKPVAKKTTIKKSTKKHTSAKKTVRKALTETKKKVRKTTSKIFSNARKKAVKETNKALASTKKLLQKKGLAGAKKPRKIVCYWWNDKMNEFAQDFDSLAKAINHAKKMADLWNNQSTIFEFFDGQQHRQITVSKIS